MFPISMKFLNFPVNFQDFQPQLPRQLAICHWDSVCRRFLLIDRLDKLKVVDQPLDGG